MAPIVPLIVCTLLTAAAPAVARAAVAPDGGARPAATESALESAVVALRWQAFDEALRHARRAVDEAAPGTARLAAGYVFGRAAAGSGDVRAAIPELRAAAESDAPFRHGARIALGEALARAGDGDEALAILRALPKDVREGERRWEIGLAEAAALEAAGKFESAAERYSDLSGKWHPRLPKEEILFRLAGVRNRMRDGGGADLFKRLALEHPETRFGDDALRLWGGTPTAEEERQRIFALYAARAYEDALRGLHELLGRDPDDLDVRLALGRLHGMVVRDDLEQAAGHLRFILDKKGRDKRKPEAAWRLMTVLGGLGRYDEALALGGEYRKGRFGTGWNSSVDYRIARLHHEAGHPKQASQWFERYLKRHKPKDQTMFAWFVGWAAFRGGLYEQALEEFEKLASHPNLLVGAKALYWSAVAHDKLGRRKKAVALLNDVLDRYPLCYYAVLAQRKLAELGAPRELPGASVDGGTPADETSPWEIAEQLPPRAGEDLHRLEWLVAVGDAPEARAAYEVLAPSLQRELSEDRFLRYDALLADAVEAPHERRYRAWRRHRGALTRPPTAENAYGWRAVYPRAYRRFARPAAAREGIPELLLYCHMLQESRYKRFAISSAPAYGILQFLDKTGRRAARDAGLPYAQELLFDPAYNARLGAYYLGALTRKYRGQIPLAIAAYNGGPRLMDQHVRQFGDLPFDVFVEEIDRHETRNYVRKVLDHYVRYVHVYLPPDERQAAIDAMFPRTVDARFGADPSY